MTNNKEVIIKTSIYSCKENTDLVKNKKQVDENIDKNNFNVVDARSRERFEGKVAEPRKGLRSGSIKNSLCLPFGELINNDHTFISKDKISEKFKSLNFDYNKNSVFSCGSGVTASVLALAYSLINDRYMPIIYDGSWSEYGRI
jgi:thiosulfate/3-mercaptopyruvate sulfurtransferase